MAVQVETSEEPELSGVRKGESDMSRCMYTPAQIATGTGQRDLA